MKAEQPAFCTPKSGHQFHSWDVGGYLPELVGKSSNTDLKICQQNLMVFITFKSFQMYCKL